MTNIEEIVGAYIAAWDEREESARRRLLEKSWSDDGVYQDPTGGVSGREALVQHIAGFFQGYPGCSIVVTSGVDRHHDKIHFTWKMVGPDGQTAIEGHDFGELGNDGRLRLIVGFFGPPPALTDH